MKPNYSILTNVQVERIDTNQACTSSKVASLCGIAHIAGAYPTRIILFASLILFASQPTWPQTTIVAIRDQNTVIVGADSLDASGHRNSCKIRRCGDSYLAVSGLIEATAGQENLALWPVLQEACKGSSPEPKVRVSKVEQAAHEWLNKAIALVRQNTNELEFRLTIRNQMVISFALVGWRGNQSYIYGRLLENELNNTTGGTRVFLGDRWDFDKPVDVNQSNRLFLGHFESIQRFAGTSEPFRTLGLVEGVKFLITTMAVDRPSEVGLPIDILRITKNGAQWIQQKPECEERKPPTTKLPTRHRRRLSNFQ